MSVTSSCSFLENHSPIQSLANSTISTAIINSKFFIFVNSLIWLPWLKFDEHQAQSQVFQSIIGVDRSLLHHFPKLKVDVIFNLIKRRGDLSLEWLQGTPVPESRPNESNETSLIFFSPSFFGTIISAAFHRHNSRRKNQHHEKWKSKIKRNILRLNGQLLVNQTERGFKLFPSPFKNINNNNSMRGTRGMWRQISNPKKKNIKKKEMGSK